MNTETFESLQVAVLAVVVVVVLYAGTWAIGFRPTVIAVLAAIIATEIVPVVRA